MPKKLENLKQEILEKVKEYHNIKFGDKKTLLKEKHISTMEEDSLMSRKWLILLILL